MLNLLHLLGHLNVLIHVHLLVLLATPEYLLHDLRGLHELPLDEELRAVQGVPQSPLRVLAVEHVPELVRELPVRHQDVFPLSKGKDGLGGSTTLHELLDDLQEHGAGEVRQVLGREDVHAGCRTEVLHPDGHLVVAALLLGKFNLG